MFEALPDEAWTPALFRELMEIVANNHDQWCGMPMTLSRCPLELSDGHPFAQMYADIEAALAKKEAEDRAEEGYTVSCSTTDVDTTVRGSFYSAHKRCEVFALQRPDGKVEHGLLSRIHSMDYQIATIDASDAWTIEQETKALELLKTLVRPRQYSMYFLTGAFLESSDRSGVMYVFRKLRPTIALSLRDPDKKTTKILCTMCMHPIGYYQGSWAGAMCPTDDVIAHLVLMRGDEHMFWRRCNQHPPHMPNAGI